MSIAAVIATARFGLGAAPGEITAAARDPRGWLIAQLVPATGPDFNAAGLPDSATAASDFFALREDMTREARNAFRERMRAHYVAEIAARQRHQARTGHSFRERLVLFWSNHFTVATRRPVLEGLAGSFEREAIHPHVTGRFRDLLGAVARHPAMLVYLDNARSIGPLSMLGRGRGRGLNENLARELMELHTLGVDGGYRQADVTELARVLTGWSVDRRGRFRFRGRTHEPGTKLVLGRPYAEEGVRRGRQHSTPWQPTRLPPATSPRSSPATSSPTSRHPPWSMLPPGAFATPTATSPPRRVSWSRTMPPGPHRSPRSARRRSCCWRWRGRCASTCRPAR
jgi:uncharacterized protein (DUF1800 family)